LTTATIVHVHGKSPVEIERALESIFAGEERPRRMRLEGTYSAVLARLAVELDAGYRYLLLRPYDSSGWTPIMDLGNHADGLEVELSHALGGVPVFTIYVYGDGICGYRLARGGDLVDRYVSDPLYFAEEQDQEDVEDRSSKDVEDLRGHPERFADLLPAGTSPGDFARVVLRPGWWEARDAQGNEDSEEATDQVDEADRMRCIGLALELWGPSEYPFAEEAEELSDRLIGPAIALAFA
jgi:hypothetical protein